MLGDNEIQTRRHAITWQRRPGRGETNVRLMLGWQRIRQDGAVKRLKRQRYECSNRVLTMES
jgi:hypothetical protein